MRMSLYLACMRMRLYLACTTQRTPGVHTDSVLHAPTQRFHLRTPQVCRSVCAFLADAVGVFDEHDIDGSALRARTTRAHADLVRLVCCTLSVARRMLSVSPPKAKGILRRWHVAADTQHACGCGLRDVSQPHWLR